MKGCAAVNPTVALLTDFGTADIFIGVMKGVMQGIAPHIQFIDISHHIEPQNVRQAAFALMNGYSYFPPETVFLVVVDPGVGTTRRPLAVRAGQYHFVAPDNGVLSYVLGNYPDHFAVELNNPQYHLPDVSDTFHGRDIFSPAAAHLANGVSVESVGVPAAELFSLPEPFFNYDDGVIEGEVLHIDRFGNITTSIGVLRWGTEDRLRLAPRFGEQRSPLHLSAESVVIQFHDTTLYGIRRTYGEAMRGELLALLDSGGFLEIAVNQGSAANRLGAAIGDRIEVKIR